MTFDPSAAQPGILFSAPGMVLHVTKMAVRLLLVPVMLKKEVLWQFKHDGKQREQLRYNTIVDRFREVPDLIPMLSKYFRLRTLILWDKLGNVEDLCVVNNAWSDLTQAKRLVTVVLALLEAGAVFEFLFGRKLKDLLADSELAVDLILCETEVDDVEEA